MQHRLKPKGFSIARGIVFSKVLGLHFFIVDFKQINLISFDFVRTPLLKPGCNFVRLEIGREYQFVFNDVLIERNIGLCKI